MVGIWEKFPAKSIIAGTGILIFCCIRITSGALFHLHNSNTMNAIIQNINIMWKKHERKEKEGTVSLQGRKKCRQRGILIGDPELFPEPGPGLFNGAHTLPRDGGDLLGGHIKKQKGTQTLFIQGQVRVDP